MDGLKVAVTGPTGDIGLATLQGARRLARPSAEVVGMARRPFDPAEHGLSARSRYRPGRRARPRPRSTPPSPAPTSSSTSPSSSSATPTRPSRSTSRARATSSRRRSPPAPSGSSTRRSVAAYGFHADNPQPLTEDVAPRGDRGLLLLGPQGRARGAARRDRSPAPATEAYVFRPSIVAGPRRRSRSSRRWSRCCPLYGQLPLVRRIFGEVPFLAPVLPDPGVPFQLVHHDDVAAALRRRDRGRGRARRLQPRGAPATLTRRRARPGAGLVVGAAAEGAGRLARRRAPSGARAAGRVRLADRLPGAGADGLRRGPSEQLGWEPRHDAADTLAAMIRGAREQDVL